MLWTAPKEFILPEAGNSSRLRKWLKRRPPGWMCCCKAAAPSSSASPPAGQPLHDLQRQRRQFSDHATCDFRERLGDMSRIRRANDSADVPKSDYEYRRHRREQRQRLQWQQQPSRRRLRMVWNAIRRRVSHDDLYSALLRQHVQSHFPVGAHSRGCEFRSRFDGRHCAVSAATSCHSSCLRNCRQRARPYC